MHRRIVGLALAMAPSLTGCWGADAYIMEGQVLERLGPTEIVVDHEAIPGLMPEMVMPFSVRDASLLADVDPGDRIVARLIKGEGSLTIDKLRVTGSGPLPPGYGEVAGGPLHAGDVLDTVSVPVGPDASWTLGAGQDVPTVLTFLYTTCPKPEFCPMVTSRLQGLQAALEDEDPARLLAVTIDPEGDTHEVLEAYGAKAGADPSRWRFGRLEGEALEALVGQAALTVVREGEIVHAIRWLVLDAEGRLIERYDDNAWDTARVLSQLRTGEPKAPAGSDGTISRPPAGDGG